MKIKTLYFLLLFSPGLAQAQHAAAFSQYMLNGIVINPAYAGSAGALDITAAQRNQWTGFKNAPSTTVLAVQSPLRHQKLNLGIVASMDKAGAYTGQNFQSVYAYRLKIRKIKIAMGAQLGYVKQQLNWLALARNDQADGLLEASANTSSFLSAGFGAYLHNDNFFAGVSMPYWYRQHEQSISHGPLFVTGGYLLRTSEDHFFKPSLLIKQIKGSPLQYDINLNYYYKQRFGFGLSYRHKESIVGILELFIGDQLRISYSYDYGISALRKYQNGSHEILLRYLFRFKQSNQNPRSFF